MSEEFEPARADLSLAALFAGWAMADEVQRRIAADGMDDLRFADGVVFQHLVPGPLAIGALGERMGVSQQAASKAVADLERRGYVERVAATVARSRPSSRTSSGRGARRPRGGCSRRSPPNSALSRPCAAAACAHPDSRGHMRVPLQRHRRADSVCRSETLGRDS